MQVLRDLHNLNIRIRKHIWKHDLKTHLRHTYDSSFVFTLACFSFQGTCGTEIATLVLWHCAVGVTSVMGKYFISDNIQFVFFIGQT